VVRLIVMTRTDIGFRGFIAAIRRLGRGISLGQLMMRVLVMRSIVTSVNHRARPSADFAGMGFIRTRTRSVSQYQSSTAYH
jgi:hypothetical protein